MRYIYSLKGIQAHRKIHQDDQPGLPLVKYHVSSTYQRIS